MSTIKVTNVQNPSAASAAITLASDGTAAATLSSVNGGPLSGTRNRIINGDMRIDQRNAGASVTANDGTFSVDRWTFSMSQTGKATAQQNAGSVTPPTGFSNYLGVTSSSAYTVGASEWFSLVHNIEGFNFSDFNWGTVSAQTVTLSFWVRSSLVGTFGGVIVNNAANRSYPFTYSIASANTWTSITVTIPGDTSGTWLSTNGLGVRVWFNLGAGASVSGAAGSWSGALYRAPTGATSVVATNGATFYITGVQLEAGSVATPFERRSYGDELFKCQRYYFQTGSEIGAFGSPSTGGYATNEVYRFPAQMRAAPTITRSYTGTSNLSSTNNQQTLATHVTEQRVATGAGNVYWTFSLTASAEL